MEKFRAYVAAYLMLVHDGKVLLLRRFNTGYQDGNYSLLLGILKEEKLQHSALSGKHLKKLELSCMNQILRWCM